jgi:hypothetical protein
MYFTRLLRYKDIFGYGVKLALRQPAYFQSFDMSDPNPKQEFVYSEGNTEHHPVLDRAHY